MRVARIVMIAAVTIRRSTLAHRDGRCGTLGGALDGIGKGIGNVLGAR